MKFLINILRNNYMKWLLVALCMITIFGMSHLDSVKSWYLTGKVLTTVTQTQEIVEEMDYEEEVSYYSAEENDFFMHFLRKLAHVFEFLTLFLLWVNALWQQDKLRKTLVRAVILTLLYAMFDEVHQLFIVGRTGDLTDVFIDSLGIVIGLLIIKVTRGYIAKKM